MARTSFLQASALLSSLLVLTHAQNSATPSSSGWSTTLNGTPTSFRSVFTIPASADVGADVLPNIQDSQAVNAQDICPGYTASQLQENERGLSAVLTLAGAPCNVYGNDIEVLSLKVEYQSDSRLAVNIIPAHVDASNTSQWIVPENLIPRPTSEASCANLDLKFDWANEPSFWFSVTRKSTGDVIFTTKGTHLVYENQFIEFVNALPEDYNLYGLGERIHGLRLNNNFTATIYAADVGDPIDRNCKLLQFYETCETNTDCDHRQLVYGSHPFYLETRYFDTGSNKTSLPLKQFELQQRNFGYEERSTQGSPYKSASHGVYYRNTHGMEVVLKPTNLTWRTLGGAIDLFFFDGPTQPEVTKQYQTSAIGLPAMQSYWAFGYHQCRWGYRNWTELREIVETMRKFEIPLGMSKKSHILSMMLTFGQKQFGSISTIWINTVTSHSTRSLFRHREWRISLAGYMGTTSILFLLSTLRSTFRIRRTRVMPMTPTLAATTQAPS
jgi:alpha-glucosidase